jgi:hypothetical protein
MNQFSEVELDELEGIPVTTAAVATPAATAPAAATNSNIQSWDADDGDDVSGTILKGGGVPYIKVAENQPARIAFVPGAKIVGAPVHYSSGENRYYVCDSKPGKRGKCCEKLGDAKGRAAAFVFHYLNADQKTAKLATGTVPQVEVGIFTMSRSNWEDVKGAVEEGSSVYAVDYRISVSEKQLTRQGSRDSADGALAGNQRRRVGVGRAVPGRPVPTNTGAGPQVRVGNELRCSAAGH